MELISFEWSLPSPPQGNYTLQANAQSQAQPILPIQYDPSQIISLILKIKDYKIGVLDKFKVEVQDLYSQKSLTLTSNLENPIKLENLGTAPGNLTLLGIKIRLRDLLVGTASEVNNNLFVATVSILGVERKPKYFLHVLERKIIILLPGVMATEISVKDDKGKEQLCWPHVGISQNLPLLESDNNGEPIRSASKLKVIQKPKIGSDGGPYFIDKWSKLLNAKYPILRKDNQVLEYLYLQEYPYDWRAKPERVIAKLLNQTYQGQQFDTSLANGKIDKRPTYASEPSIAAIRAYLQKQSPFFSDKVAVAGHSTGGVILNGLIRTFGVEDLVDQAFFIATPFYGAPKAYNAFITGTMQLGTVEKFVLNQDTFKRLGPNLAVLYYLAPTAQYPSPVATLTKEPLPTLPTKYSRNSSEAGKFINDIITEMRKDGDVFLESMAQSWHHTLDKAANLYHTMCFEGSPLILPKNCTVFYSNYTKDNKPDTIGAIAYTAAKSQLKPKYDCTFVAGDGTVPMESLKGNWVKYNQNNLVKVEGNLDHVQIINNDDLWKVIFEKCRNKLSSVLNEQMSVGDTLFPHFVAGLNYGFSYEQPIMLNGMKVIFDQPVGVYPVTLESKAEARRNGN